MRLKSWRGITKSIRLDAPLYTSIALLPAMLGATRSQLAKIFSNFVFFRSGKKYRTVAAPAELSEREWLYSVWRTFVVSKGALLQIGLIAVLLGTAALPSYAGNGNGNGGGNSGGNGGGNSGDSDSGDSGDSDSGDSSGSGSGSGSTNSGKSSGASASGDASPSPAAGKQSAAVDVATSKAQTVLAAA
jgi:hypothetical protein